MEKTGRKPVDRQATFDTDPHRANLAKGSLKLPVIESQEKEKTKDTKESKNNQAVRGSKNSEKNITSVVNKDKKIIVKGEGNEKDQTIKAPSVKVSESSNKSSVLSNINKKIANNTDKESKEVRSSKDSSEKLTEHINKNQNSKSKGNYVSNNEKDNKSSKDPITTKSSSQKVVETKSVDNKPAKISTVKVYQQSSKSTNDSDSKQKAVITDSKSPEKQHNSKASVLKDLNNKRSNSPSKVANSSPKKEIKSGENVNTAHQSSKTVASKSPQNDKNQKHTPRKPDTTDQGSTVKKSKEIESPRKKSDTKQGPTGIKDPKSTPRSTLPVSNAPVETHLSNTDHSDKTADKKVKITPRFESKSKSDKTTVPNENILKQSQKEKLPNQKSDQNKPILNGSNNGNWTHSDSDNTYENKKSEHGLTANQDSDIPNLTIESEPIKSRTYQLNENGKQSPEKVLTASVQSKNETYVLSPSPSKIDSKLSRSSKVSRPNRLSPTNETVEPIKLEQRPPSEKIGMDGDRRESYSQVYAERNTLLNAEYTYRKRIKQLEEEANGFLKAIDELTTENKYLRDRVERLEDGTAAKGGDETNDKIAELEKDKGRLENKIKDLERAAKIRDNSEEELRELKEQVVKLQTQNQSLQDENSKIKAENDENLKKLRMLEAEKKSLETSVTDVESEKLDKIQDLNKEHKALNKQLAELNTKNKGLEKKVDALEYENKTLSETLAQKKSELGELLGVMKDENKFDNEVKDLKNQILKLNKEKREAEMIANRDKRVLNEKLKETKEALDSKTKDADELKIKVDQVETEHKKMKHEFDPMKKLVEAQKKEIAKLKEEIERLKQLLKEKTEAFTNLENETTTASKDIREAKDQLESFNIDLQKIVFEKESQISKLINQLDTMREEREDERKTSKEEKEKLASEMEKVETYQENNKRLETDLKHYVEKLDESKLKEKQLTLQLEDKGFEVSNLEQQLFEMNMKVDTYSKRMSDLDREKRDMEREKREWEVKKDKIDDIEASNKRLLEENKRLRNQIEMTSYASSYRSLEREVSDKPVLEAWVGDKNPQTVNQAIYVHNVQKDKPRESRRKKVHLVQPPNDSMQKKRMPFSKSSPVKAVRQNKHEESKSSHQNTHRSLEDLRKVGDTKTPESEHSLPELNPDARVTMGYAGLAGYREIHKNRIRAAHKKIYPIH